MAADFAEKEREFLDSLAGDTGRDLAQWMEAIRQSNLEDRNAIIDWLRTQGFLFAKASWLERIHHNGGRPIYADLSSPRSISSPAPPVERADMRAVPQPGPATGPATVPSPAVPRPALQAAPPSPAGSAPIATAGSASQPPSAAASLDDLLSEAKAYRPLAQFVLREIERRVSGFRTGVRPGYVALLGPKEFGALTISPRELRLALALAGGEDAAGLVRAKFAKTHPNMPGHLTHMIVLTDARQVTAELLQTIAAAAGYAASQP